MIDLKDKRVLIIGLGRSGIATINVVKTLGAKISIQDKMNKEDVDDDLLDRLNNECEYLYFNSYPDENVKFDYIVVSPGVDPEMDYIQNEIKKGAELIGELELSYRLSNSHFVGITGTNGKTTTTTMVGEIFKNAGLKANVVGNIGIPVLNYVMNEVENEYMITEVSSFQLQTTDEFKPHVAAILNVTPDHLNRHHTLENYALTKAKISKEQTKDDYLILNYDDKLCYSLKDKSKATIVPFSRKEELDFGAYLDGENLVLNDGDKIINFVNRNELNIIGDHNVENALAAIAISYFSGIEVQFIVETLKKFQAVEHRMEFVREIDGVKYYNDSKGTNVDATIIAIKAIEENILLIAGGDAKSQNFDELAKMFPGRVKHLLLFGRDCKMISESCDKIGFTDYSFYKTLEECIIAGKNMATVGDTVLLSPACASWDMYKNFEIRGQEFKDIVNNI